VSDKNDEQARTCCTVKVVLGQKGGDCCTEGKGERVIKLDCGSGETEGRTIKVICCPEPEKEGDKD